MLKLAELIGNPIVRIAQLAAVGGTYDEMLFGPVPTNEVWYIERVSATDETHDATSLRVYLTGFGEDYPLYYNLEPKQNAINSLDRPFFVPEGRSISVRFYGATAADVLKAVINGLELNQV